MAENRYVTFVNKLTAFAKTMADDGLGDLAKHYPLRGNSGFFTLSAKILCEDFAFLAIVDDQALFYSEYEERSNPKPGKFISIPFLQSSQIYKNFEWGFAALMTEFSSLVGPGMTAMRYLNHCIIESAGLLPIFEAYIGRTQQQQIKQQEKTAKKDMTTKRYRAFRKDVIDLTNSLELDKLLAIEAIGVGAFYSIYAFTEDRDALLLSRMDSFVSVYLRTEENETENDTKFQIPEVIEKNDLYIKFRAVLSKIVDTWGKFAPSHVEDLPGLSSLIYIHQQLETKSGCLPLFDSMATEQLHISIEKLRIEREKTEIEEKQKKGIYRCNNCFKEKQGMFLCSKCKNVRYCCKDCQKDDWPSHKLNCQ